MSGGNGMRGAFASMGGLAEAYEYVYIPCSADVLFVFTALPDTRQKKHSVRQDGNGDLYNPSYGYRGSTFNCRPYRYG